MKVFPANFRQRPCGRSAIRFVSLMALIAVAGHVETAAAQLVAAYSFEEGTGTTVGDVSGNGNTGSVVGGASWTTSGRNGGALSFDGVNDRVFVNSSTTLNVTTGVTVEAWVYPTANQSGWRTIVQKEIDAYLLHAGNDAGALRPAGGGTFGGVVQSISAPSAIAVNTWTHLAMTYDGSAIRVFVNGVQVTSAARSGTIETNGNALSIGGTAVYGEYFQGHIDDVRIYNRALAAAEITNDMNTPVGGTPPPPDTEAPSAPTGANATALSSTQIAVSWIASTDNIGVTGYRVERCTGAACTSFVQVGTPSSTGFNDSNLSPSTTYRYRVRAEDASGNLSGYSGITAATTQADIGPIAFRQVNYATPQTPQTSVQVTYSAAQTAGNLNVVVVGWRDAVANIVSVTDTSGNVYELVAGPTVSSSLSQAIYYASGIIGASAGSNGVTVTFDSAANLPDVRVLEYSGIDAASPVDTGAEASGTGTLSATGSVQTTHPYVLLFAANTVQTSTSAAGFGYTQRIITPQGGNIAEDRTVTSTGTYDAAATLQSSGTWIMQLVAFRGANPPQGDITPPAVSITSPGNGSTVSGSITLSASASDASGVGGVQFQIDGVDVGQPDKTSPFSITFNTAQFANGVHTVSAYAWDNVENIGNSTAVSVTFNNASPGNPSTTGLWLGTQSWPYVAIHTHLLPDGRVLASDGQTFAGFDAKVWNPKTNTFVDVETADNIFCAGHALLPDGRLFVAGGHVDAHVGINDTNLFDWRTNTWTAVPPMQFPRWYPTVTTLPDGRMLVQSGESNCDGCEVPEPEIYNPATNAWTTLTNAAQYFPYYPHSYVMPDGRIFVPATSRAPIQSKVLNLATQSWSNVGGPVVDGASSVMYAPGRILKAGTSVDPDTAVRTAFATAYVIDMTAPSPTWRQVSSMTQPRAYLNMVNLPDGNVLAVGGGRTTDPINYNVGNAVLPAEQWSPTTETWTPLASMSQGRLYHSTAILLPDARVLVTGGGRFFGGPDSTDQPSAEIFAPPYLFRGARPVISSAPAQIAYNEAFTVGTAQADQVSRVVLTRLPSVTHNIDMNQTYVSLTFSTGPGSLSVNAPANANLAPPGHYMLFIVNASGVPSLAAIVKL